MLLPLLILILITSPAHALQPLRTPTPLPVNLEIQIGARPLIIFFDPCSIEKQDKITTIAALTSLAVRHKSAPLLISHSLWDIVLSTPRFLESASFKASEWHVCATHDKSLLLFIPRIDPFSAYLDQLNDKNTAHQRISNGELLLGLKLNSLLKIDDPLALSRHVKPARISSKLKPYLNDIMIRHADITHVGEQYLNQWDIFLIGHGFSAHKEKGFIAGMHAASFEAFLDF